MKFFLNEKLIPDDGSKKVLSDLERKVKKENIEINVFPDIHYKKGSSVTNGLLTKSKNRILTSMLGVTNCGFTFGKIEASDLDDQAILTMSKHYSKKLESYSKKIKFSEEYISDMFVEYALKELDKDPSLKNVFGLQNKRDIEIEFKRLIPKKIIKAAQVSLGTLGGGNHFFEIQKAQEVYQKDSRLSAGDYVYILHSDSIAVGNLIQIYYSNLNELWYLKGLKRLISLSVYRVRQLSYFGLKTKTLFSDFKNTTKLIYGKDPHRCISSESIVGQNLLKSYFFASIFGEMNRDMIVSEFFNSARSSNCKISDLRFGSHSHDSISVENYDGQGFIVQRNGVQHLKDSSLFALPGALGTESYIMANPHNDSAYRSSNHGVGRIMDKHVAKGAFSESATIEKLNRTGIKIFKVGTGSISEQDPDAFKDVEQVVKEMEYQSLGNRFARLFPICSLKG
ncbi:RtcB family protein [Vibrio rotiferianus]|uniref:RtcB family protein n=1 Tax=Vibrio rotiferianus TaxID=190895 RepID=UPI00406A5BC8